MECTSYSATNWLTVFGSEWASPRPDELDRFISAETPHKFELAAFPNPFNPQTMISYTLPEAAFVEAVIYDISGRAISRLFSSDRSEGSHAVLWSGALESGAKAASGVYIVQLSVYPRGDKPAYRASTKLILTK
jgi:hypothetical protein